MLDFSTLMNLSSVKPQELIKEGKKGYNKECINGDFKILKNGGIIYSEAFRRELAVELDVVDVTTGEITGTKTVYRFIDFASGNASGFLGGNGKGFIFGCIVAHGSKVASIQGAEGDGTKVTYVKDVLIPMIAEVYGIDWEVTKEVEMSFLWDKKIPTANGKHYIPRIAKNGSPAYVTRENADLMPCVPTDLLPKQEVEEVKVVQQELPFPGVVILSEANNYEA